MRWPIVVGGVVMCRCETTLFVVYTFLGLVMIRDLLFYRLADPPIILTAKSSRSTALFVVLRLKFVNELWEIKVTVPSLKGKLRGTWGVRQRSITKACLLILLIYGLLRDRVGRALLSGAPLPSTHSMMMFTVAPRNVRIKGTLIEIVWKDLLIYELGEVRQRHNLLFLAIWGICFLFIAFIWFVLGFAHISWR